MGYCTLTVDGLGTTCHRCGAWRRGRAIPACPPYVTRLEPDNRRLPHITTTEQNARAMLDDMAHSDPVWADVTLAEFMRQTAQQGRETHGKG